MMKKMIIVIGCLASVAIAGDVQMSSLVVTNGTQVRSTMTYTRDGATNLVRITTVRKGITVVRSQRVYHNGKWAWVLVDMTNGTTWLTQTGLAVRVAAEMKADGQPHRIALYRTDSTLADLFSVTNGLLSPATRDEIDAADQAGRVLKEITEAKSLDDALGIVRRHQSTIDAQNKVSEDIVAPAPNPQH